MSEAEAEYEGEGEYEGEFESQGEAGIGRALSGRWQRRGRHIVLFGA